MDSGFNLRSNLWEMKDRFTDVSLVCGKGKHKEVVRAHKIILAGLYFLKFNVFFRIKFSQVKQTRRNDFFFTLIYAKNRFPKTSKVSCVSIILKQSSYFSKSYFQKFQIIVSLLNRCKFSNNSLIEAES